MARSRIITIHTSGVYVSFFILCPSCPLLPKNFVDKVRAIKTDVNAKPYNNGYAG